MKQAKIKIINIIDGELRVLFDKKTNVTLVDNKYFFKTDEHAQEIVVSTNKIKIIRPEMIINLKLDTQTTCLYKHQDNELKINFFLNKITKQNKDLQFNYSILDDNKKEMNNINVEIKF